MLCFHFFIMEILNTNTKRISWIDLAKCFGIFFIVLGHVYIEDALIRRILYSFHVPLFFILSGFTYKHKKNKTFILNKIRTLYIPYIVCAIISILIYLLLGSVLGQDVSLNFSDLVKNLFGMLYANASVGNMLWNRPLWFIPALFVCLIIINLIEGFREKRVRLLLVLLLTALGMFLSYKRIFLPLQTETALSMLIWVYIGILTKPFMINIKNRIQTSVIAIITVFLLGAGLVLSWYNGPIEVMIDYYSNNIFFYFITAYSLSFAVILFSILIKQNSLLEYVGKNTLFLLLWSKFPILVFQEIIPGIRELLLSPNFLIQNLTAIVISVITIIICLFGQFILNKLAERLIPQNVVSAYHNLFK